MFIHTWSIISQVEIYLTNFQIRFSQQPSVIYKNVIPRFRHIFSRRIILHPTVLRLLLPNRVQLNSVCTKIVKKRVKRINTRTTFGGKLVGSWPTLSRIRGGINYSFGVTTRCTSSSNKVATTWLKLSLARNIFPMLYSPAAGAFVGDVSSSYRLLHRDNPFFYSIRRVVDVTVTFPVNYGLSFPLSTRELDEPASFCSSFSSISREIVSATNARFFVDEILPRNGRDDTPYYINVIHCETIHDARNSLSLRLITRWWGWNSAVKTFNVLLLKALVVLRVLKSVSSFAGRFLRN